MQISAEEIKEVLDHMESLARSMGLTNGAIAFAWQGSDQILHEVSRVIGQGERGSIGNDHGRSYRGTAREKISFSSRTHQDSGDYLDSPAKLGEINKKGCSRLVLGNDEIFFACSGFAHDGDDKIVSDAAKQRFLR